MPDPTDIFWALVAVGVALHLMWLAAVILGGAVSVIRRDG